MVNTRGYTALEGWTMPSQMSSPEAIYAAILALPVPERLKLVERVVHDVAEPESKATGAADAARLVGMMADEPEVMDQARNLRARLTVRARG
jgi:hypothetical protein